MCSYTSDLGAGIRPQTPDTRSPSALSTETFGDSKLQMESFLCVSVVCVGALIILSNSMSWDFLLKFHFGMIYQTGISFVALHTKGHYYYRRLLGLGKSGCTVGTEAEQVGLPLSLRKSEVHLYIIFHPCPSLLAEN